MVAWSLVEFEEGPSTQSVAMGLASMGAPEGTTVMAKSQSAGHGRLGRIWHSPLGGLYMSFVLKPSALPKPEQISLVTALAVVEGIGRSTAVAPKIRWPNDVMVGDKKLAGIIAEAQTRGGELSEIVVGIGINCNTSVDGPDLQATSLSELLGRDIDIVDLRLAILSSFSDLYDRWQRGEGMTSAWARSQSFGDTVSIKLKTEENPFSGKKSGLDAYGNLVVLTLGRLRIVRSEDLEWLRER